MDDRAVADGDVAADGRYVRPRHGVHDGPVLNIRPSSDANRVHVAAQHGAHPHAALLADFHVADHLRAVVDERGWMHVGNDSPVGTKHC